jgi:hypothetical protein
LTGLFDEACADRVHDDVARSTLQIIFTAQGSIEIAFLPKTSAGSISGIEASR